MERIKNFLKEYRWYILILFIAIIVMNIRLPYYVLAPGGIIKIDDRIQLDDDSNNDSDGSINLLYATSYEGNVSSVLLSFIMKNWDLEKMSDMQVSDENTDEISLRNKIMLDNSISSAIYVAYTKANKDINIVNRDNYIIGTISDNGLKIGDKIISVNGIMVDDINTIKDIVKDNEVNTNLTFEIERDNEIIKIDIPIVINNNQKQLGIVMITNYEYELEPSINIKFKESESGPSGGLMMAVSIYNAITEDDITKGLNIAGTGTIDSDGNVGEIDGIKYKIIGAVRNKMDIIFVPSGNYEEAITTKREYNYDIEIVSVDTFDEVIDYLIKK